MAKDAPAKPKKSESLDQLASWLPAIIVVVALLYAGLAWFMLFVPKISPLMEGGKYDYSPLVKEISKEEAYIKKVNDALSEYNAIPVKQRERLANVIPVGVNFPSLMAQLEAIGTENNMLMDSLDINTGVGMSVGAALPIQLTVAYSGGSNKDFINLLEDFERSLRLLDVRKFQYSPIASGHSLFAEAYYLPVSATP